MGSSIPAGGAAPEPPEPREFDPVQILETLDRHGVSYVVIGGLAATLHGSPTVTVDVDLAAEQSQENLGRLAAALTELDAVRYTDPEAPMTTPAASDFTFPVESFASPVGRIDVFREVAAVGGFERLRWRAEPVEVAGIRVLVAGLDDIIASKEAAGRGKDAVQLPLLYALRDELRTRPDRGAEEPEPPG